MVLPVKAEPKVVLAVAMFVVAVVTVSAASAGTTTDSVVVPLADWAGALAAKNTIRPQVIIFTLDMRFIGPLISP